MKIALISIHYPPLRSSCAVQMRDLAQELLREGHEPLVIVPTQGLNAPYRLDVIESIPVYRISSNKMIDIGYMRRAINEILLPFSMLLNLRKSDFPSTNLDAVVWYSPTIFFGPLVYFLKKSSQCPSYLILRDIFPEWALDLGLFTKGPIYYLFKLIARYQYSVANVIGVQTDSNLKYLFKWKNKPNRKLEVLHNWLSPALKNGTTLCINDSLLRGRKIFIYIGNMGVAQGMDILIELANKLRLRSDIGFLFVGRGSEVSRLQAMVNSLDLNNVLFHNEIDPSQIPSLLKQCQVGLIALDPRHTTHNIPGKFLTYLQAGLPVLARVNSDTDLLKVIENYNIGRSYTGSDIEELSAIAEELIDNQDQLLEISNRQLEISNTLYSTKNAVHKIISSLNSYSTINQ